MRRLCTGLLASVQGSAGHSQCRRFSLYLTSVSLTDHQSSTSCCTTRKPGELLMRMTQSLQYLKCRCCLLPASIHRVASAVLFIHTTHQLASLICTAQTNVCSRERKLEGEWGHHIRTESMPVLSSQAQKSAAQHAAIAMVCGSSLLEGFGERCVSLPNKVG